MDIIGEIIYVEYAKDHHRLEGGKWYCGGERAKRSLELRMEEDYQKMIKKKKGKKKK